jgi:hypothetical protein
MVYNLPAKVYDLPAICFAIKSWTPRERSPFLVYDLTAIDSKIALWRQLRTQESIQPKGANHPQHGLDVAVRQGTGDAKTLRAKGGGRRSDRRVRLNLRSRRCLKK